MVLKTKEENRTNAQDKPLRLRAELVHLFPLVVQKLSSLIITEFTKYKSNSLSKGNFTALFDKASTEKNKNRTVLEKHLNDFISRNSFDYFIHKDLGGFLKRELDFYIKNEVLFIDDINTENPIYFTAQLSKIKALKTVASKIIAFLAQIEDFQKKLWLKKKFVISTNYCITLDRIPEKYFEEIFANEAQLAEWKTLFDVAITSAEAEALEALRNEPYLVLDTKFFSEEFKDKLLAEFDNLDEETDGLLINSENFQALNVMQEKYQEKVNTIYIDPPYNTGNDGFTYKDNLQHSSWMSLMENRLSYSKTILNDEGTNFISIDDNELTNLKILCDSIFNRENFVSKFDWRKKTGANDAKDVAIITESILLYTKNYGTSIKNDIWSRDKDSINQNRYNQSDEFVETRGKFYYDTLDRGGLQYSDSLNFGIEAPDGGVIFPNGRNLYINDGWIWKWSKNKVQWGIENKYLEFIKSGKSQGSEYTIKYKVYQNVDNEGNLREKTGRAYSNLITDPINQQGNIDMINLFSGTAKFSNPKPVKLIMYLLNILKSNSSLILDYFAGSGTTGHATIKLNREDQGKRKFILVEMGTYFNTVTKPRIQKVIYSDNWKNGKPQDTVGISQMFKYQVLESYEDALNNLQLGKSSQDGLFQFSETAQEDYLLNYMLDVETQDHLFNIGMFRNPFNYQLKVTENNELVPTKVDLVETFNYLIGMYVSRVQRIKDIKVIEGKTREGIKTLIIWRNLETTTHDEVAKVFRKLYDGVRSSEFDQIYINGDHHFDNIRTGGDTFKVKLIEETFFKKMFNISEL